MTDTAADRSVDRLEARWQAAAPFVAIGALGTVAGGLVAAATRPTGFELGSWLAAFLVLVAGAAQIVLGLGQAWLAADPPQPTQVRAEAAGWNFGVGATIVGSLASAPLLSTLGGLAFALALGLFLAGVRRPRRRGSALILYRGVAVVVLGSTPVGVALAWIRHG